MNCPECGSSQTVKIGKRRNRKFGEIQKLQCAKCGRYFQDKYSYAPKVAEDVKE